MPERILGYRFRDPALLELALTHRSFSREKALAASNERLEFLGDAVLGLRVSERLSAAFPASSEGQLTRQRAGIVSAPNLAEIAQRLELGRYLRLSKAEESIGGRGKQRLLANALEAIIAAVHLDGGYAASSQFIDEHVLGGAGAALDRFAPERLHQFGYKGALQEWAHAHGHTTPRYRLVASEGPDHAKLFTAEVSLAVVHAGPADAPRTATGSGSSRKAAEQAAAGHALAALGILTASGTSESTPPRPE